MHMLVTILHCAYSVCYKFQTNFPGMGMGRGGRAGLIEIKANSASQLELELKLG